MDFFEAVKKDDGTGLRKQVCMRVNACQHACHVIRTRRAVAEAALLAFCLIFAATGTSARAQGRSGGAGNTPGQISKAVRTQLLKLIPDPLPGKAHAQGNPAFYGENLWEYIDGAADQFQHYGLVGMLHQVFQAGKISVTVDIYSMGDRQNAFGMYAAERSPNEHFISVGTEGYLSQSSDGSSAALNFLQGRYYVKLLGFGSGSPSLLETFAHGIASRISDRPGWPEMLALFPASHRMPHTGLYVLENPLGHDFLSPAYSVKYKLAKGKSTLVVSVAASKADALHRLELLKKHLLQDGKCAPAPDLGKHAIRGGTSYEGEMEANAAGHYLVIMVNPAEGADKLFREVSARLK